MTESAYFHALRLVWRRENSQRGFDQFPVKDEAGKTYGVLTAQNLLTRLGKKQVTLTDNIKQGRRICLALNTSSEVEAGETADHAWRTEQPFVLYSHRGCASH